MTGEAITCGNCVGERKTECERFVLYASQTVALSDEHVREQTDKYAPLENMISIDSSIALDDITRRNHEEVAVAGELVHQVMSRHGCELSLGQVAAKIQDEAQHAAITT